MIASQQCSTAEYPAQLEIKYSRLRITRDSVRFSTFSGSRHSHSFNRFFLRFRRASLIQARLYHRSPARIPRPPCTTSMHTIFSLRSGSGSPATARAGRRPVSSPRLLACCASATGRYLWSASTCRESCLPPTRSSHDALVSGSIVSRNRCVVRQTPRRFTYPFGKIAVLTRERVVGDLCHGAAQPTSAGPFSLDDMTFAHRISNSRFEGPSPDGSVFYAKTQRLAPSFPLPRR